MSTPPSTPPGFYPDPDGSGRQRWFDGNGWTDHTQDAPTSAFGTPAPSGFGSPVGGGYGAPVGADKATTALVCASLGVLCCGPLGIVAVVQGKSAKDEAERTGRPLDSKMNAAYIVGIVAVVLWILGIVAFAATS